MMNNIVFQNELVSVVWNNERLALLDSDGNFIDYFFYIEDLNPSQDEQKEAYAVVFAIKEVKSESQMVKFISNTFDNVFYSEVNCGEEDIKELREKWGDEYVVRIGSTAVIIKE